MVQNVTVKVLRSVSEYCHTCQGECWNSQSQSQTQQNVFEKFGVIPNDCINDANGKVHCPAALGLV